MFTATARLAELLVNHDLDQLIMDLPISKAAAQTADYPGTSRNAFPRNTAEFRAKCGDDFATMLIAEGNKMRKLMGWGNVDWLYKGCGIFQFDLQFVDKPAYEDYFRNRRWHDFDQCLSRVMEELAGTWLQVEKKFPAESKTEKIRLAIKAYNGSGARAEAYSQNVMYYTSVAAEA